MAEPSPNQPQQPKPAVQPFFDKQGRVVVERRGLPRDLGGGLAKDAYHFLVTSSWLRLLAFLAVVWVAINLLFAAVLFFGHAEILNARDGSFLDRFWFSVQTMATIGYGYLAPMDSLAHIMVLIESLVGILITAMVTGLFFAKFSRPNAKVLFSRVAVVADMDGERFLMIRMANARSTAIVEATAHLTMTSDETLGNGQRFRRVHDLHLRRTTSPVFALSWTIFHVIDDRSPLHGLGPEGLRGRLSNFVVTFTGIDDSLAAAVHTRASYGFEDIRWDEQFVDILVDDEHGRRYLDFSHFHDTTPVGTAPGAGSLSS